MNNPIKVSVHDISYPNILSYMYIDGSKILYAYPLFAIKSEDGAWWKCVPDHENSVLVGYKLKYSDDSMYECIDPLELKKIGLELDPSVNKQSIGFINS